MSQRKMKADGPFYYTTRKMGAYNITLRVASISSRAPRNKSRDRVYSVCMMDENLDFVHRCDLSFRAAKKLCKAWCA
ncbi:hypothetical protein [Pseudomonas phage Eisa9]|uniref:Uncharacterized protein n=1 Tax=Pseudomonas phage Eisa9 TaxID=2900148 RepID=A0AAE8YKI4_9CAUD|nr:hypothetical protein [Pseudomonas phage Eisa9]